MRRCLIWSLWLVTLTGARGFAETPPRQNEGDAQPAAPPLGGVRQTPHLSQIIERAKGLGPWSEQARWIAAAHQAMWQRNGWTSEPDQFAMRLATAVETSPPWRLDQRLDTVVRMTSERYSLDSEQQADLRARITRQVVAFTARFAPTLIQNFELFVDLRTQGRPLDAEAVADLVRASRPVFEEFRKEIDPLMTEFENTLREEQREIFRRDRQALEKRVEFMAGRLDEWAAGRWRPEEWGMDHDPLWKASHGQSEPEAGAVPPQAVAAEPSNLDGVAAFETAWELYVRQFIERYQLDAAQQTTARAILADLQKQAALHWEKCREEYDMLTRRPADGSTAQQLQQRRSRLAAIEAPIDALYQELVRRLDALPTTAQQRAARPPDSRQEADTP